jgi:acyl carrier protein
MEMVGYLEEQLGVTFPEEVLPEITTFGDLAALIERTRAAS